MVQAEQQAGPGNRRIVLKPNASLSQAQALAFFLGIFFVSASIGIAFACLGYWTILPFYGGEMILLGCCLYSTVRDSSQREVITITETCVRIEKGARRLEQWVEFQRGWAKVRLEKSELLGHPSRLAIRSHGREIEIGHFLIESERCALADELEKSLLWPIEN